MSKSIKSLQVALGAGLLSVFGGAAIAQNDGAISGQYTSEPTHAYITFDYLHQGFSRPVLRWDEWTGTLDWNAEDPSASSVEVTIKAESINSGVEKFDDHLKNADFFEVETYPEITFKSTKVEVTGENTGKITGDLTIKDNTKPVTLDVVFNRGAFVERSKAYKLGFSASGTVLRSDFGVDLYVPFVGDEVNLNIQTEFEMAAE